MRKLIQFILTMSHGQADAERGFSVNEELLVGNMQKGPLISGIIIYDHMKSNDIEPHNIKITKELLAFVKLPGQGIVMHLKKRKKKQKLKKI